MEIVHIILPSGNRFPVLAEILMNYSTFVQAALRGSFKEPGLREVKLEGDIADKDFGLLLEWIYKGGLRTPLKCGKKSKDWLETSQEFRNVKRMEPKNITLSAGHLEWAELTNVWILADYLGMPKLQNHIVDVIIHKIAHETSERGAVEVNEKIWTRTKENSPLQQLFIHFMANQLSAGSWISTMPKEHQEWP